MLKTASIELKPYLKALICQFLKIGGKTLMGYERVEVHFLDTFPQIVTTTSVPSDLIALQSLKAYWRYLMQIITFQLYPKRDICSLNTKIETKVCLFF